MYPLVSPMAVNLQAPSPTKLPPGMEVSNLLFYCLSDLLVSIPITYIYMFSVPGMGSCNLRTDHVYISDQWTYAKYKKMWQQA